MAPAPQRRVNVKKTVKIGRPGYRVTKQFDDESKQRSLLFQVRSKQRNSFEGQWRTQDGFAHAVLSDVHLRPSRAHPVDRWRRLIFTREMSNWRGGDAHI